MTIILAILVGVITGTLSSLLGIGGGAIMVVLAVYVLHVSQHVAQAVALAAIIPTAATGALSHHRNGLVNWQLGVYLAIGGIIGGLGGSYLANLLDNVSLSNIFSVFFALIGIRLFISSYKTFEAEHPLPTKSNEP